MDLLLRLPPLLLRGLFVTALVTIFILAMIPLPEAFSVFSFQDKLEHCASFVVLMLMGWAGGPRHARPIAIGLVLYGLLIEVCQDQFTLNRVGDPWDLLADTVGVLIGLGICTRLQQAHPALKAAAA